MNSTKIPRLVTKFFQLPFDNRHLKNFDIEKLPWLKLNLEFKHSSALIELTKQITPHSRYFTQSEHNKGLNVYDIYGPTDRQKFRELSLTQDNTDELNKLQYAFNKQVETNTLVQNLFSLLPYKKIYEIYINSIDPGGFISPHKDNRYGKFRSGIKDQTIIHLNNPDGYRFALIESGDMPKDIGVPVMLNTNKYIHSVMNDSNEIRYLVHIHGDVHNEEMEQLMLNSFYKSSPKIPKADG